MKPVDAVIRGGTIVRSAGSYEAGIAIDGGRVVGIMSDQQLPPSREVIDARGKIILAGIIDTHVHMRYPGKEDREDAISGGMAAAAGGVTTFLDMPNTVPPVNCAEVLNAKKELLSRTALVDFALYGGDGESNVECIPELAQAGAVALKTFLWPYPDRKDEFEGLSCTNDDALLDIFEAVADTGLVQVVHCEKKAIVDHYTRQLQKEGRRAPSQHPESRPILAEAEAVSRVVQFAIETGARLNIPHVSCGSVAAIIKAAKEAGYRNVTAETCPQYLFLTSERHEEIGPYAKVNPPLRPQAERDRLWDYLLDGTIDTIGSDHAPNLPEQIEPGWTDIFAAPAGRAEIETSLPLMLSAVNQGKLSLNTLTQLMSENAARLYGLYPRKGVIEVGADADLVIVDMNKQLTIDHRQLYTKQKEAARMFDGWQVTAMPVLTMVRGTVVMRDGRIVGQPGHGQFVSPLRIG